jgi:hypothetical protein
MIGVGRIQPGDTLGRYDFLLPIASGGMATVWASRLRGARGFTKMFAIKTMLPDLSEDPDFQRMFLDEAGIASRIHHPNVVETLELGEHAGLLYIVMEWVDGVTLGALLKAAPRSGHTPLPIGLKILIDACQGVHAAHELRDEENRPLGLVHRDVSPPNILMTYDGEVKLADFGVAKASQLNAPRTRTGIIKGKFRYIAPEQYANTTVDRRTDIFALGIILYQLTTGRHPWNAESGPESLERMMSMPPIPPGLFARGYPEELERIVLRAISREPAQRFQTAAELGDALRGFAASLGWQATREHLAAYVAERLGGQRAARRDALRRAMHEADVPAPHQGSGAPYTAPSPTGRPVTIELSNTIPVRTARPQWLRALGVAVASMSLGYCIGGRHAAESIDPPDPGSKLYAASSGSWVVAQVSAGRPSPTEGDDPSRGTSPESSDLRGPAPADRPNARAAAPRASASAQAASTPLSPPLYLGAEAKARAARNDGAETDVGF